jgi:hypothetical protein
VSVERIAQEDRKGGRPEEFLKILSSDLLSFPPSCDNSLRAGLLAPGCEVLFSLNDH